MNVLAVLLNDSRPHKTLLFFISAWGSPSVQRIAIGRYFAQDSRFPGELTDPLWGVNGMRWTADGSMLVMVTGRGHVTVVSRFGEPKRIVDSHQAEWKPAWILPFAGHVQTQPGWFGGPAPVSHWFSIGGLRDKDKRGVLISDGQSVFKV